MRGGTWFVKRDESSVTGTNVDDDVDYANKDLGSNEDDDWNWRLMC